VADERLFRISIEKVTESDQMQITGSPCS